MNVEEQEKRLLDYKWHERRYSKDTCYILSTQGTEEPNNESCCTDIRKYEKKEFDRIIVLNLTKVLFLLGREGEAYDCSAPILEQVLCRACQRWEQEGLVDVLSTCILYVYEFYPRKVAV